MVDLTQIIRHTETRVGVPFNDLEITTEGIQTGLYKHFKGKNYEVMGLSEWDSELVVVYKALYKDPEYGKNSLWMRPKEMFDGYKEQDGEKIKRFQYVGEK